MSFDSMNSDFNERLQDTIEDLQGAVKAAKRQALFPLVERLMPVFLDNFTFAEFLNAIADYAEKNGYRGAVLKLEEARDEIQNADEKISE